MTSLLRPSSVDLVRGFSQYRASAVTLIVANAVPLLGVLFLGWDAFAVVLLYWAENVILGMINVLKMVTCSPDPDEIEWSKLGTAKQVASVKAQLAESGLGRNAQIAHHGAKLFLVPFFVFHYGLFCLVHGIFVFVMFGREGQIGGPVRFTSYFLQTAMQEHLIWAILALGGSHLFSFFVNYLGRGEYRRTLLPFLMFQPYARIVVLHIAILFGGFFVMMLGSPIGMLVLLIVGKTMLDLSLHLAERARNAVVTKQGLPDEILAELPN